ncbi:histone-lysine N-methyltransferase EHMT1-like [Eublepharis macularius]|uniref:Histone-lysine N-methyltransferase EHMT1-like n=1 Tax=Eublepharis macularius TaxID=481883 RepID=A0AA97K4J8_EUBMA|nr:histone-lysine N-methyltransferase EHMT1-like [Eublepharis macularius]
MARKGHYDTACRILSLGTEAINSQDSGGRSPLFWATEYRQESLVELLLAHGADPAVRDKEGNLCLHWAASVGCAPIARMLLEAGSDLNALNDQGDTPLHVAAQERRYKCIILLLAHGAEVCLKNKAGRTPLQCARVSSPSWSALQAISSLPQSPAERVLSRDISRGFEQVPIPCFNGVDDEPCPSNFLYVTQNIMSDSVAVSPAALGRIQHCKCSEGCSMACCPCILRSKRSWYTMDGRLVPDANNSTETGLIFECNTLCSCARFCPNRVVQRGVRVQLQLCRMPAKGWGVRTMEDVPRGAFVCQYFGEVISSTEAGQRQEDTYYFVVDMQTGQECCLDGRFYGNVGRFLNHSCQPNLVGVQVAVGQEVPGIAFFSTRPIRAGEELGFDYGDKFWEVKGEGCACLCGSPTCRYQVPRSAPSYPAAAGDVSGPSVGTRHHPLRGFALKSKRMNPLKVVTRSQHAQETSLDLT